MPDLLRKRLAVMFTDIAGFTSLMEKNEAEGMEAHAMIISSLNDLDCQNIKDLSGRDP